MRYGTNLMFFDKDLTQFESSHKITVVLGYEIINRMKRFELQLKKQKQIRSKNNMNNENYPYSYHGIKLFESKGLFLDQDEINNDYYKISLKLKKLSNR